jgi:hypothetical protein
MGRLMELLAADGPEIDMELKDGGSPAAWAMVGDAEAAIRSRKIVGRKRRVGWDGLELRGQLWSGE